MSGGGLEDLERLVAMRRSGALDEIEFQAAKKRLLLGRKGGLALPLIGGLLVGLGAASLWWMSRGGDESQTARPHVGAQIEPPARADATPHGTPPEPAPVKADISHADAGVQKTKALEAAYGEASPGRVKMGDDEVAIGKSRVIWATFGPVLVSQADVIDAAHVQAGKINVHYLEARENDFRVRKAFMPAVESGSFGTVGEWSVSSNLTGLPLVYVEGGGTWQGYTCGFATLVELQAARPVELVTLPIAYSDGADAEISGKIANIVPNVSFDVIYTGSATSTDRYVRRGDAYVLQGGGEPSTPTC